MDIVKGNDAKMCEIALYLADVHRKTANYAEARKLYEQTLKSLENLYGENHPQVSLLKSRDLIFLKGSRSLQCIRNVIKKRRKIQ
jgi:hypothetical protein